MQIDGTKIVYADHVVVLTPQKEWSPTFCTEYVQEMADTLAPEGTARQHAASLRNMHNDGSWGIKKK